MASNTELRTGNAGSTSSAPWRISRVLAYVYAGLLTGGRLLAAIPFTFMVALAAGVHEAVRGFLRYSLEGLNYLGREVLSGFLAACAGVAALVWLGISALLALTFEAFNIARKVILAPLLVAGHYIVFGLRNLLAFVVTLAMECVNGLLLLGPTISAGIVFGVNVVIEFVKVVVALLWELCALVVTFIPLVFCFLPNALFYLVSNAIDRSKGLGTILRIVSQQGVAAVLALFTFMVTTVVWWAVNLFSMAVELVNLVAFEACIVVTMGRYAWEVFVATPVAIACAFLVALSGWHGGFYDFAKFFRVAFNLFSFQGITDDSVLLGKADKIKAFFRTITVQGRIYPGNAFSKFSQALNPRPFGSAGWVFQQVSVKQPREVFTHAISHSNSNWRVPKSSGITPPWKLVVNTYSWFRPQEAGANMPVCVASYQHWRRSPHDIWKASRDSFEEWWFGVRPGRLIALLFQPQTDQYPNVNDLQQRIRGIAPSKPAQCRREWDQATGDWALGDVMFAVFGYCTEEDAPPDTVVFRAAAVVYGFVQDKFYEDGAWQNTVDSSQYIGRQPWLDRIYKTFNFFTRAEGRNSTTSFRQARDWAAPQIDGILRHKTRAFVVALLVWPFQLLPTLAVATIEGLGRRGLPGAFAAFCYTLFYLNVCVPYPFRYAWDYSYQTEDGSNRSIFGGIYDLCCRDIEEAASTWGSLEDSVSRRMGWTPPLADVEVQNPLLDRDDAHGSSAMIARLLSDNGASSTASSSPGDQDDEVKAEESDPQSPRPRQVSGDSFQTGTNGAAPSAATPTP